MKKRFLNYCLNTIKNNNSNISEEKLDELRYGLEGFYLTITKAIFIFIISFILGIFKEMLIMLVIYNILRLTGFGLHASKSWQCWVSSTIIFIFFPFLAKYITIPYIAKIILGIIGIILIYLYSPADTIKRPIVSKKRRDILKFITTINCIILVSISLFIKDNIISNLFIFGIYIEIVLINPLTYKLFNLSYNNYINYVLNSNV